MHINFRLRVPFERLCYGRIDQLFVALKRMSHFCQNNFQTVIFILKRRHIGPFQLFRESIHLKMVPFEVIADDTLSAFDTRVGF